MALILLPESLDQAIDCGFQQFPYVLVGGIFLGVRIGDRLAWLNTKVEIPHHENFSSVYVVVTQRHYIRIILGIHGQNQIEPFEIKFGELACLVGVLVPGPLPGQL